MAVFTHACECVFLFVVIFSNVQTADIFTAIAHLQQAFESEISLADHLEVYIAKEKTRLHNLERISSKLRQHGENMTSGNLERHLSNPLTAYTLITDIYDMTQRAEMSFEFSATHEEEFSNATVLERQFLPDQSDVEGAINAIIRLQDTYNIPASVLARSELAVTADVEPSAALTGSQCMEIGKISYFNQDDYHAVPWFLATLEAYHNETAQDEKFAEVLDYLSFSLYRQGDVNAALNYTEQWLNYSPDHTRAQQNKEHYLFLLQDNQDVELVNNKRVMEGFHSTQEFASYEKLCRGERTVKIKDEQKLSCQYVSHNNPLLLLSPAKEEVLIREPRLVFYHDVLNDREIEVIKSSASPLLQRSGLFAPNKLTGPPGGVMSDTRVSKSAWLHDSAYPDVIPISRRVGAIASLDLGHAEAFQVLNYGIGGHYEPHVDFARATNENAFRKEDGNRIATFILYLTDVIRGGATVFPKLGAAVWPEKGGAAFWYNLQTDGTPDERTLHGACPVLLGYKWARQTSKQTILQLATSGFIQVAMNFEDRVNYNHQYDILETASTAAKDTFQGDQFIKPITNNTLLVFFATLIIFIYHKINEYVD